MNAHHEFGSVELAFHRCTALTGHFVLLPARSIYFQQTQWASYFKQAGTVMLIYLDANIVQYCADYEGFLFRGESLATRNANLVRQHQALQKLIELEQFGHWEFAASGDLLYELHRGRPSQCQLETYEVLAEAATTSEPEEVDRFLDQVRCLGLQHADERHLAIAAAMGASWFITNDTEIVRKVEETFGGSIGSMRVDTPAGCVDGVSKGLILV